MKLILALLIVNCALFIGAAFAQEQYIIVSFSAPMDRQTLFVKSNYTLYDENLNQIPINKIGVAEGDTAVVIYTNFLSYKTNFIVRVQNVKDKANGLLIDPNHNSGWFYCDGYNPNETKPYLIIK